jgi:hypothetical protein
MSELSAETFLGSLKYSSDSPYHLDSNPAIETLIPAKTQGTSYAFVSHPSIPMLLTWASDSPAAGTDSYIEASWLSRNQYKYFVKYPLPQRSEFGEDIKTLCHDVQRWYNPYPPPKTARSAFRLIGGNASTVASKLIEVLPEEYRSK